jgi:serine/threonine protein phosphatase PrpC
VDDFSDDDEETAVDLMPPSFTDPARSIEVRTTVPDPDQEVDVLECKGGSTEHPLTWDGRVRGSELWVEGAAITHVGLVREGNEDAFLVWPQSHLAVIADGMGGHQGGEVAAAIAVEAIRDALIQHGAARDLQHGKDLVELAVYTAHARINEVSGRNKELAGMGTTLVVVWVLGREALVVHVGDSRLYRMRGGQLQQVTADHSLAQELKSRGILDTQGVATFPNRHVLTQALGGKDAIKPSASVLDVLPGDRLLLCSDGLSDIVSDDLVERMLASGETAETHARMLVELALQHGGKDNVTVVVAHVEGR